MRIERGVDSGKKCLKIWLEKHDIPSSAQKLTKNNWTEIFKKEKEFWFAEFKFDKTFEERIDIDMDYEEWSKKEYEKWSKEFPNDILVTYKPNPNIPFIFYRLIRLFEDSDIVIEKNKDCDGDNVYEKEDESIRYFSGYKLTESEHGHDRRFARAEDWMENLNWFKSLLFSYLENKPYILISEFEVDEYDTDDSYFEPAISEQDFADLYVDEDVLVLCETKELAEKFLKLADYFGYTWCFGEKYTDASSWDEYGKYTGYCIFDGTYGDIRWEELEFDEKIKFKEKGYKNIKEIKNKRKEGIGVTFEIGDRVECIDPFMDITKGCRGVIVDIEDCIITVNWDKNINGWGDEDLGIANGHGGCMSCNRMKLIERPIKKHK